MPTPAKRFWPSHQRWVSSRRLHPRGHLRPLRQCRRMDGRSHSRAPRVIHPGPGSSPPWPGPRHCTSSPQRHVPRIWLSNRAGLNRSRTNGIENIGAVYRIPEEHLFLILPLLSPMGCWVWAVICILSDCCWPMPMGSPPGTAGQPILWFSPDPRFVLPPQQFAGAQSAQADPAR